MYHYITDLEMERWSQVCLLLLVLICCIEAIAEEEHFGIDDKVQKYHEDLKVFNRAGVAPTAAQKASSAASAAKVNPTLLALDLAEIHTMHNAFQAEVKAEGGIPKPEFSLNRFEPQVRK